MPYDILIDGYKVERDTDGKLKIGPYTFDEDGKGVSREVLDAERDAGFSGTDSDRWGREAHSLYSKLMEVVKGKKAL